MLFFFFLVLTAPQLRISANNATYQLFNNFDEKRLKFRFLDVKKLFAETPLLGFHERQSLMPKEINVPIFMKDEDITDEFKIKK